MAVPGTGIRETSPRARIGMMLARVFEGWEDRTAARRRLGKTNDELGGAKCASHGFVRECFDEARHASGIHGGVMSAETGL